MAEEPIITPWEVRGKIDYEKLIKQFGTKPLTEDLVKRIEKKAGFRHVLLKRKVFFSHRDLDKILDYHDNGKEFALYTGRGPSGQTQLGHLVPWVFCKYLQDAFGVELYFELTDDEKFFVNRDLSLEEANSLAYENALDIIAIGFNPKKTFLFTDTEYIKTLYPIAAKIAKRITNSTARAVFGFTNETNIGLSFYPAIQAAVSFLPSVLKGKPVPVLIPAAIDQDPYWRGLARELAEKLGYPKPAQIHCKFFPGLAEGGKMSSSDPNNAIFTSDNSETIKKKINRAFTGGQATAELQRQKGANPDVCNVCHYLTYMFEPDDKNLNIYVEGCRTGKRLCGENKEILAEKINNFLKKHQAEREKAKKKINKFFLRD